ncbi:MAG: phosphodiester glycosidase family protein [Candidatus Sericytochromatia bacterium]
MNKKLLVLFTLYLSLIQTNIVFAKDNYELDSIDKNAQEWSYFINGYEITDYPEIYISKETKYFPIDILKNLGASYVIDYKNKKASITTTEESFEIKDGSKLIYINNKNFKLPYEVLWRNNTFYIPSSFLTKINSSVGENKYKSQVTIIKALNILNEISSNVDNSETKITLNCSSYPIFEEEKGTDFYKITLLGTNVFEKDKLKKQLENISSEFSKIELDANKGLTKIIFYAKNEINLVNTYSLEKPDRLIIQFPKNYRNETKILKNNGIYHSKILENNSSVPNKINILEIDPKKNLLIKPIVAKDKFGNFDLKELSKLSKGYKAYAGINAGYFSTKIKSPVTSIIINGETISQPWYNRTALVIDKNNNFDIKNIDLNVFLKIYNPKKIEKVITKDEEEINKAYEDDKNKILSEPKTIKVNAYNLQPKENQIVIFNYNYLKSYYNKNTNPNKKENEYVFFYINPKDKTIVTNPDTQEKGYYIYAEGKGKENLEKMIADNSTFDVILDYSIPTENILHAVGGGPTLIKNGVINVTAEEEQFKPDITNGRAPRTALGILKNNKLIFFTVDGRQESSKGMTLNELASYLKKYNVISAMNFDGGGSTGMFLDGKLINSFSDKDERPISSALLVFIKDSEP